jgi:GTP cyclohydrolase I
MNISQDIKKRLADNKVRYYANDNISKWVDEQDLKYLVDELTEKFEGVLDTLIIDTTNDPNSQGTARRLAKMYIYEIMSGRYQEMPEATAFPNTGNFGKRNYTGMLVVRSEIRSMCSHHHQPVNGVAYIGILPHDKVIGLSKYSRLAQWCARRGTLQEELCNDIASTIIKAAESDDVGVYLKLTHGCCENRGIMACDSTTQTTVLSGEFHTPDVKKEFFDNIQIQEMGK